MTAHLINSIGLVLDIFGAILIFFFGFPHADMFPDSGEGIFLFGKNPNRTKKITRYMRIAKAGLILIILGFLLQFVSNYT